MNREKLEYLQKIVMPHVASMTTCEDWRNAEEDDEGLPLNTAVFNLDTYIETDRKSGSPISDAYDCGYTGCLAGWYKLLAVRDNLIEEDILPDFDSYGLADHFDIPIEDSIRLFTTLGAGAEEAFSDTEEALHARIEYLNELLAKEA